MQPPDPPNPSRTSEPPIDPSTLLAEVSRIAVEAGVRILEVYQRDFEVQTKADSSPLTEADLAAHRHITARLKSLTPQLPVLSEEAADAFPHELRRDWGRFWLVDPLDGTKEFVKRNGEFTVNIALVDEGAVVLGVVHAPVLGLTYAAAAGAGAWRSRGGEEPEAIRVRAVAPAADEPMRVVASRSHAGPETQRFLDVLGRDRRLEVVSQGSALKICLVADGDAQLYPRLGPTMEWDTAAAQCVAEQAGGFLVDLSGAPLRYNKVSLLNPYFLVSADAPTPYLELLRTA